MLPLTWRFLKAILLQVTSFCRRCTYELNSSVLDWLLFIFFVVAMFTGVVISEAALPALGFSITVDPFWSSLHDISANLLMVILGIHLAMHWNWIVVNFKKYILRRPTNGVAAKGGK